MKINFAFILLLLAAASASAAVLTTIPSPMVQGGMIHINVVFDETAKEFSVHVDSGTPELKPLSLWSPGNTFDPSDPWYHPLNTSEQARLFNSQYGFLLDVGMSDPIPAGKSIGIRLLTGTTGLESYFYKGTDPKEFQPLFSPSHDYVLWSGTMWHTVFTMPFATAYESGVAAQFEFFLADEPATGFVDWTTTAAADANYTAATQVVTWTAIPEPSAVLLFMMSAGLAIRRRRV